MTTIIIGIVLLIVVLSFLVWTLNQMLTYTCPFCLNETGSDEILIPVIPNVSWYCPSCNRFSNRSERIARTPGDPGVTYEDLQQRQKKAKDVPALPPVDDEKPRF